MKNEEPRYAKKWCSGWSLQYQPNKQKMVTGDNEFYASRRDAKSSGIYKTKPINIAKKPGINYKLGSFKNVESREDLF